MPDGNNAFHFEPAIRVNTAIVLALAGASGSGKTKSALELAVGLAGPAGKILIIDSEGGRAKHYADEYRFYHYDWRPPYSPKALGDILREGERQGFNVIIVDSMSSEHEDEGGLCDMAEAALEQQRGDNKNTAAAWARPKAEHKRHIVRWLRQCRCHVIFCLRASEKVRFEKVERNGRSVTAVVPVGWSPISEKNLLYDVTTSLLFTPDEPGVPKPIKLYDKHKPFFPLDRRVSREAGKALAEWSAGGAPVPDRSVPGIEERANDAIEHGLAALQTFWHTLSPADQRIWKATLDNDWKPRAIEADRGDDAPIPFDEPASPPAGERPGEDRANTSAIVQQPRQGRTFAPRPRSAIWADPSYRIEPQRLPLSDEMDWPNYGHALEHLIGEASEDELGKLRADNDEHLARMRREAGDSYRRITEAIRERVAALGVA